MSTNDPFAPNPYGQIPSDYSKNYQPSSGGSPLGIISIVFSSASWLSFCCCVPFSVAFALGGIVTGHIAALSIDGKTTGIIGLALGYLNLLFSIAMVCIAIFVQTTSRNAPVKPFVIPSASQVETTSDPAEPTPEAN